MRNQKGFTIMEMLIYMGILTIFIMILVEVFNSILDVNLESESIGSVEQDGRFIIARLIYDIPQAQNIITPGNIGEQDNQLTLNINGVNYNYRLNNGNLILTNNNGADVLNGYDTTVSNLNFYHIGNTGGKNDIRISFMLTSKTKYKGAFEAKTYQTTVGIR